MRHTAHMGGEGAGTERVDGRTARALRTKAAVVDAMLALIEEGDLRPTAPRIAERAGVSLRSVFQHFTDLDTLFRAAAERQFTRHADLHRSVSPDLPVVERIAAFAAQRCRLWEAVGPVRLAAEVNEPFSPELTPLLTFSRKALRSEIEWLFPAELDTLDDGERKAVLDAADTAASFPAWMHQRYRLGHSAERVEAATALALRRLLAPG